MPSRIPHISPAWLWSIVGILAVGVAYATSSRWLPEIQNLIGEQPALSETVVEEPHAEHDHEPPQSLPLTPQARKNIGLQTGEITLTNYARSITVPAMVTERIGDSNYQIAAPLTGVVTGMAIVRGEAVRSGKVLFTLRLTHEDLVQVQTELLSTLENLDVERKELARLEAIPSGAIPRTTILERQYQVNKLEAALRVQQAAMRLHGLTQEQIDEITETRELLREVQIAVPFLHDDATLHSEGEPEGRHTNLESLRGAPNDTDEMPEDLNTRQFVVQTVGVRTGEAVQAGQMLCLLSDYSELYIEGQAFEQDAAEIVKAANEDRQVVAIPELGGDSPAEIPGLDIVYVSNEVDRVSRAQHFYVGLPNEIVRDAANPQGRHFLTWKHKPGQRMQIRVPVEQWEDVIVLPVDAVAEEGPERYVFVENGDRFDRRPVHVTYHDQFHAVIANDGSVYPGETVALNQAHQLQMALKNQAGGAVDPHAGHNH